MLPLCMNMRLWKANGWQLDSESAPTVVARTCAKTREEVVLRASRARLVQFQAGVVEVKMQGSGESSGVV